MRRLIASVAALALLACGGGGDGAPEGSEAQRQSADQTSQQLEQARQEMEKLRGQLTAREDSLATLRERVSALRDSLEQRQSPPNRLVDDPRFGCVPWAQNPELTVCTLQSLSGG